MNQSLNLGDSYEDEDGLVWGEVGAKKPTGPEFKTVMERLSPETSPEDDFLRKAASSATEEDLAAQYNVETITDKQAAMFARMQQLGLSPSEYAQSVFKNQLPDEDSVLEGLTDSGKNYFETLRQSVVSENEADLTSGKAMNEAREGGRGFFEDSAKTLWKGFAQAQNRGFAGIAGIVGADDAMNFFENNADAWDDIAATDEDFAQSNWGQFLHGAGQLVSTAADVAIGGGLKAGATGVGKAVLSKAPRLARAISAAKEVGDSSVLLQKLGIAAKGANMAITGGVGTYAASKNIGQEFSDIYQRLEDEGVSKGEAYTRSLSYALGAGGMENGSDAFIMSLAGNRGPAALLARRLAKVNSGFVRRTTAGVAGLATGAATEGVTEGAQRALQNVTADIGSNRGIDLLEGVWDEAKIGAMLGGAVRGTREAAIASKENLAKIAAQSGPETSAALDSLTGQTLDTSQPQQKPYHEPGTIAEDLDIPDLAEPTVGEDIMSAYFNGANVKIDGRDVVFKNDKGEIIDNSQFDGPTFSGENTTPELGDVTPVFSDGKPVLFGSRAAKVSITPKAVDQNTNTLTEQLKAIELDDSKPTAQKEAELFELATSLDDKAAVDPRYAKHAEVANAAVRLYAARVLKKTWEQESGISTKALVAKTPERAVERIRNEFASGSKVSVMGQDVTSIDDNGKIILANGTSPNAADLVVSKDRPLGAVRVTRPTTRTESTTQFENAEEITTMEDAATAIKSGATVMAEDADGELATVVSANRSAITLSNGKRVSPTDVKMVAAYRKEGSQIQAPRVATVERARALSQLEEVNYRSPVDAINRLAARDDANGSAARILRNIPILKNVKVVARTFTRGPEARNAGQYDAETNTISINLGQNEGAIYTDEFGRPDVIKTYIHEVTHALTVNKLWNTEQLDAQGQKIVADLELAADNFLKASANTENDNIKRIRERIEASERPVMEFISEVMVSPDLQAFLEAMPADSTDTKKEGKVAKAKTLLRRILDNILNFITGRTINPNSQLAKSWRDVAYIANLAEPTNAQNKPTQVAKSSAFNQLAMTESGELTLGEPTGTVEGSTEALEFGSFQEGGLGIPTSPDSAIRTTLDEAWKSTGEPGPIPQRDEPGWDKLVRAVGDTLVGPDVEFTNQEMLDWMTDPVERLNNIVSPGLQTLIRAVVDPLQLYKLDILRKGTFDPGKTVGVLTQKFATEMGVARGASTRANLRNLYKQAQQNPAVAERIFTKLQPHEAKTLEWTVISNDRDFDAEAARWKKAKTLLGVETSAGLKLGVLPAWNEIQPTLKRMESRIDQINKEIQDNNKSMTPSMEPSERKTRSIRNQELATERNDLTYQVGELTSAQNRMEKLLQDFEQKALAGVGKVLDASPRTSGVLTQSNEDYNKALKNWEGDVQALIEDQVRLSNLTTLTPAAQKVVRKRIESDVMREMLPSKPIQFKTRRPLNTTDPDKFLAAVSENKLNAETLSNERAKEVLSDEDYEIYSEGKQALTDALVELRHTLSGAPEKGQVTDAEYLAYEKTISDAVNKVGRATSAMEKIKALVSAGNATKVTPVNPTQEDTQDTQAPAIPQGEETVVIPQIAFAVNFEDLAMSVAEGVKENPALSPADIRNYTVPSGHIAVIRGQLNGDHLDSIFGNVGATFESKTNKERKTSKPFDIREFYYNATKNKTVDDYIRENIRYMAQEMLTGKKTDAAGRVRRISLLLAAERGLAVSGAVGNVTPGKTRAIRKELIDASREFNRAVHKVILSPEQMKEDMRLMEKVDQVKEGIESDLKAKVKNLTALMEATSDTSKYTAYAKELVATKDSLNKLEDWKEVTNGYTAYAAWNHLSRVTNSQSIDKFVEKFNLRKDALKVMAMQMDNLGDVARQQALSGIDMGISDRAQEALNKLDTIPGDMSDLDKLAILDHAEDLIAGLAEASSIVRGNTQGIQPWVEQTEAQALAPAKSPNRSIPLTIEDKLDMATFPRPGLGNGITTYLKWNQRDAVETYWKDTQKAVDRFVSEANLLSKKDITDEAILAKQAVVRARWERKFPSKVAKVIKDAQVLVDPISKQGRAMDVAETILLNDTEYKGESNKTIRKRRSTFPETKVREMADMARDFYGIDDNTEGVDLSTPADAFDDNQQFRNIYLESDSSYDGTRERDFNEPDSYEGVGGAEFRSQPSDPTREPSNEGLVIATTPRGRSKRILYSRASTEAKAAISTSTILGQNTMMSRLIRELKGLFTPGGKIGQSGMLKAKESYEQTANLIKRVADTLNKKMVKFIERELAAGNLTQFLKDVSTYLGFRESSLNDTEQAEVWAIYRGHSPLSEVAPGDYRAATEYITKRKSIEFEAYRNGVMTKLAKTHPDLVQILDEILDLLQVSSDFDAKKGYDYGAVKLRVSPLGIWDIISDKLPITTSQELKAAIEEQNTSELNVMSLGELGVAIADKKVDEYLDNHKGIKPFKAKLREMAIEMEVSRVLANARAERQLQGMEPLSRASELAIANQTRESVSKNESEFSENRLYQQFKANAKNTRDVELFKNIFGKDKKGEYTLDIDMTTLPVELRRVLGGSDSGPSMALFTLTQAMKRGSVMALTVALRRQGIVKDNLVDGSEGFVQIPSEWGIEGYVKEDAFDALAQIMETEPISAVGRVMGQITGWSHMAVTGGNLLAAPVRQGVGNFFLAVQAGAHNPAEMKRAGARAFRSWYEDTFGLTETKKAMDPELGKLFPDTSAYKTALYALGLRDQEIGSAERAALMAKVGDYKTLEASFLAAMSGNLTPIQKLKLAPDQVMSLLGSWFQVMDNAAKDTVFASFLKDELSDPSIYQADGKIDPNQARRIQEKAAEYTKSRMPTMSRVTGITEKLRKLKMAPFVSFTDQAIQISIRNPYRDSETLLGKGPLMEGATPHMQEIYKKRARINLIGWGATMMMPVMITALTRALGVSDEEEEEYRSLLAPFERHSTNMFMWKNADGDIRSINFGFANMSSVLVEPSVATVSEYLKQRDVNPESQTEALEAAMGGFVESFVSPIASPSIGLEAGLEAIFNRRVGGGEVVNPAESGFSRTTGRISHFAKSVFVPSVVRPFLPGKGFVDGVDEYGNPVARDEVLARLVLPVARPKVDYERSFQAKTYEATRMMDNADRLFRSALRRPTEAGIQEAQEQADKVYRRETAEMTFRVAALRRKGLTNSQISATLGTAGVSKRVIAAVLQGESTGFTPPVKSLAKAEDETKVDISSWLLEPEENRSILSLD